MLGVWPTSPPSPRPCLTGSPSTAPTTTTPYRWPFAKEKVAYSPLTSLPPPSSLLHIYTLIKRSRIDESTMYAMFKTSLKKSVLTSHTDHDNLSVEVKSSAVICIIDITTSAEVLHFDESAIFFLNFHRAFGSVFKEILI